MEDFKGAMSPETEKELGEKFKFQNAILEIVDDPLITIIDNNLFDPLMKKLPAEYSQIFISALAEVVSEMNPIEI